MTQKTITINGKRFTAKQIKPHLTEENEVHGGGYRIILNGQEYLADYYYESDAYFIPDDVAADGIYLRKYYGGGMADSPIYLPF